VVAGVNCLLPPVLNPAAKPAALNRFGQPVRYAVATGGAASWWLAAPLRRWLA